MSNSLKEESIFRIAAEIASPEARSEYLLQACGNDEALINRLRILLRADHESPSFLESPPLGLCLTLDQSVIERPGDQIGPYKLREKIGEGGFGVVYVAEQKEPVSRKVALKVIKPGMDSKDIIARFEAERQALAMMDHPNVAKVLDAGATESGRPYFVMELVHGVAITEYCDSKKLTNRERLKLFIDVCHAVQHAHQKGIIHRDIKPSNVMVTMADHKAIVKVIDFGVAKALHQNLTDKSIYTGYGQMIGTPMYMSPEQAQLCSLDVDTRSDIYSLGVLLYELLTGTTPFDKETFKQAGFDEVRRLIREVEPRRPSEKVSTLKAEQISTISDLRSIDQGSLNKGLRGDLDWIVMKALDKDRSRRYETVIALADDVQRFLNDEPVEACPPSTLYRFRKFARRNKVGFAFASLTTVFLLTAVIGLAVGNYLLSQRGNETEAALNEAEQNRKQAIAALAKADENLQIANANETVAKKQAAIATAAIEFVNSDLLGKADPHEESDPELKVKELLDRAAVSVSNRFVDQPLVEAQIRKTLSTAYHNLGRLDDAKNQLKTSRDIYAQELGPDSLEYLIARRDLVWMSHFATEKYAHCLHANQKILKQLTDQFGKDHKDTLQAALFQADYKYHLGQYHEAASDLQVLRPIIETTLGTDHEHSIETIAKLASVFSTQDRAHEAEQLFREALERQIRRVGPHVEGTVTLSLSLGIANCMLKKGHLDAAKTMLEELLVKYKRALGNDHSATINCMRSLAKAHSFAGEHQTAVSMLEAALKLQKARLGEQDRRLHLTMNELALAYSKSGHPARALPIQEQLLELARREYGPKHPYALRATLNLGSELLKADRSQEALKLLKGLAEHADLIEASSPKFYRVFLNKLGLAYRMTGQSEQALSTFAELRRRQELAFGANNTVLAKTNVEIGRTHHLVGAIEKAIAHFEVAVEILTALPDSAVTTRVIAMHELGKAYVHAGQIEKGAELLERALQEASALDQDDPLIDPITQSLAVTYWQMNQLERSVPLFERLLKRQEMKLGRNDRNTQITLLNLGVNYKDSGRLEDAIPLLEEGYQGLKDDLSSSQMGLQLIDAYLQTGQKLKAKAISDHLLQNINPRFPENSLQRANLLAGLSFFYFLEIEAWKDARSYLRQCLTIREKANPERWSTFNTRSMLGEALLGEHEFAEAESLLLSGYRGLVEREEAIPPAAKNPVTESLKRLVVLYETWHRDSPNAGYDAKAAEWQKKLEERTVK